jgi:dTDP-4-amino-4,6-dideoxygalactose transaminase
LHDEHSRPKLSYPISENLAKMGFYLPSGLTLSQEEISFVSKQLKSILVH